MPAFKQRIAEQIKRRQALGLERKVEAIDAGNRSQLHHQQQSFNNFSSNDYLGLAADKGLISCWQQNLARYGCGSAASPLVVGQSYAHLNLQQALCDWLDYPAAVLFNSGFSANQALLFALLEEGDTVIQDKLNHASLIEAGMLSSANMRRYPHNDMSHLSRVLGKVESSLVVTEGVFSMDGDMSPLADIASLSNLHNAWLMVDDAHGIGVLGEQGRGSCHLAGIRPQILVVTFGKALGISGAAILCDTQTADYLNNFARHFVYSTAMPPAQAATLTHAIDMVRKQQWRRDKLHELQDYFDKNMSQVEGFVQTHTPIKPLLIGRSDQALNLAQCLRDRGQWVTAIRPPTVPTNMARIRITLSASHSTNQLSELVSALHATLLTTENAK
ncbi:8-amino-7-oxononanoate synthase [Vibrio gallicus]|uniref:8-amino-7-oxononanoate synthase n=1 Tax=Vibrio gallicus TaxID=190897 RepID=UPI0021C2CC96|nr:8-amino-7-oxononanoate synthase [Vibrio gallicus]